MGAKVGIVAVGNHFTFDCTDLVEVVIRNAHRFAIDAVETPLVVVLEKMNFAEKALDFYQAPLGIGKMGFSPQSRRDSHQAPLLVVEEKADPIVCGKGNRPIFLPEDFVSDIPPGEFNESTV